MSQLKVTLEDIERARASLRKILEPTPLLFNRWLSEKFGCQIYLKLENMQPIGSFKIRGATYKISRLSSAQKKRGVVAASAGNHAQGVAWGCQRFKTKAKIFMPANATLAKIQATQSLGAEVILEGASYDDAYDAARKYARKTGITFVHPYEDHDVISGQGTVGLEIAEQLPDVQVVIGSMGGGGLMSGVGTALKALNPDTTIVGLQAEGARSLVDSLRKGKATSTGRADTFADGIKVIRPSPAMVSILKGVVDRTATVPDEQIAGAVLDLLEKGKVLAEGSGALPLAVLSQLKSVVQKKKVVLIISGGNIDMHVLARIIDRGLILSGRRVRINVIIKDKPGSLQRLTQFIAGQNANILQVIHDRDAPSTGIDETGVELTLETRGQSHCNGLIRMLRQHVVRLELLH